MVGFFEMDWGWGFMKFGKRILAFFVACGLLLGMLCLPVSTVWAEEAEWEYCEYVIDESVVLALGENSLTLSPDFNTTIFEFIPEEPGVYRFSVEDENALVGYWGAHTPFVMDYTEEKCGFVEWSVDAVGPSILIGISGVDTAVLTAERVGDVFVRQSFIEVYESSHKLSTFSLPVGAYLVDVDGQPVLGADGFYHLNTADGPLVVIDFTHVPMDLAEIASLGQMNVAYLGEDGHFYKTDYSEVLLKYAKKKLYPVTEELAAMIQAVSDNKGWVTDGYITPQNPNHAWLAFCKRVKGADVKWQLNSGASADSGTVDLRLISWVDSLDYSKVSFFVTIGGQTVELSCSTVYTAIRAGDRVITDPGSLFEENAAYFVTYTIEGVPAAYFDTDISVYTVWTDLDGVERTGGVRSFYISDAL